jgi:type I restriction enzyme, S subunit
MTRWPHACFADVIQSRGSGTSGLPQSEWAPKGKYPVIGQGAEYIEGWTDREDLVVTPNPALVLYGGHTRRAKLVHRPFVPGPNVRILEPASVLLAAFLFRFLEHLDIESRGYADHFPEVRRRRVPVPTLAEQRRIAEILDKADVLRAKRRAALAQLDTFTQSIFLDMFGDPIINTRGWPRTKLSSLGMLERGVSKHRPRNDPELMGGPYPFVQTGDVANCNGYICGFTSTYSDAGLRQSRLWQAGTLCITIAANIAKTGILTFDACFPDSVVGFRASDPATVEFVRGWLSFLQASLEDRAPESAQKNINLEILRGLDVPTPNVDLQRDFARRIAAIERLKVTHRTSLAAMDALFASLQHRAFRGEL